MKFNESQIVFDYLNGESAKKIAEKLGTYNTSIRRVLLRNNVKLRDQSEAQVETLNMFEDLTKEEVQYWLGFLAADGTISTRENAISLEIQGKDLSHLKKYSVFTNVSYKQIPYPQYGTFCYRVTFKNKRVKQHLMSLGITNKKSKTLDIKFDFNEHFLRGVFDGDGYVRVHNNNGKYEIATMSVKFKEQISNYLTTKGIKNTTVLRKDGIWLVGIYTQSEVKKFYTLIYNNATVFLERKKAVICPLMKKFSKVQNPQIR